MLILSISVEIGDFFCLISSWFRPNILVGILLRCIELFKILYVFVTNKMDLDCINYLFLETLVSFSFHIKPQKSSGYFTVYFDLFVLIYVWKTIAVSRCREFVTLWVSCFGGCSMHSVHTTVIIAYCPHECLSGCTYASTLGAVSEMRLWFVWTVAPATGGSAH